ncbi:MAG: hypothetical protein II289_03985, partial [Bacteroidales bacterium]|nr:hypothetical protein [Bacteroidales bacterium]
RLSVRLLPLSLNQISETLYVKPELLGGVFHASPSVRVSLAAGGMSFSYPLHGFSRQDYDY